jgi:hypothetical protein
MATTEKTRDAVKKYRETENGRAVYAAAKKKFRQSSVGRAYNRGYMRAYKRLGHGGPACVAEAKTEAEKARKKALYQKKWRNSPEGKAYIKRYRESPKGKASKKRYSASPKGKAAQKRYAERPETKAAQKRYQASPKAKAIRAAWLSSPNGVEHMAKHLATWGCGALRCTDCGQLFAAASVFERGWERVGLYRCVCDLCQDNEN